MIQLILINIIKINNIVQKSEIHYQIKMINKFVQTNILTNTIKFAFSSGHHAPTPTKLEKATSTLYIYLFISNKSLFVH